MNNLIVFLRRNPDRMQNAIKELLRAPQNNLKIFKVNSSFFAQVFTVGHPESNKKSHERGRKLRKNAG